MKGLALAERYFLSHGLPAIKQQFPQHVDRIAAGLIGPGSDCLGFDDEVSKDHDWGPGFCLWLTDSDFDQIGDELTQLYEYLPSSFDGFERGQSEWGRNRVGVFRTSLFYQQYIGSSNLPTEISDWFYIPEDNLSVCTSGRVFTDPLGEFSNIRKELLAFYPDDVCLVKIAGRCMSAGQSGQYNYQRCLQRLDHFSMRIAETEFCSSIISIIYLINRQYKPYYKWQLPGVADLPIFGREVAELISSLIVESDPQKKQLLINRICEEVIGVLISQGLSSAESLHFLDHGEAIHKKIRNFELRSRDVWLG